MLLEIVELTYLKISIKPPIIANTPDQTSKVLLRYRLGQFCHCLHSRIRYTKLARTDSMSQIIDVDSIPLAFAKVSHKSCLPESLQDFTEMLMMLEPIIREYKNIIYIHHRKTATILQDLSHQFLEGGKWHTSESEQPKRTIEHSVILRASI